MAKPEEILAFSEWMGMVHEAELRRWILDDFWHDRMDDTEIVRFFKLWNEKKVDMRSIK